MYLSKYVETVLTKTQNNVKVVRVERSVVFRASKLFHFLFCVGLFVCAWNRYCFENSIDIANRYNVFVYVLYGVLLFFFIRTYNACLIEYMDTIDTLISLSLATSISDSFIYILTAIVWEKFYYPWIFLVLIAAQIVCNFIWADVTIRLFHHKYRPLKTVVIYKNKSDLKQLQDIRRFYRKFNIVKYFENPLKTEVLDEINGLKAIILAGVTADFRNKTAEYCVKRNIHFFFLPQVGDVIIKGGGSSGFFNTLG